jgi:hypothetical protein
MYRFKEKIEIKMDGGKFNGRLEKQRRLDGNYGLLMKKLKVGIRSLRAL